MKNEIKRQGNRRQNRGMVGKIIWSRKKDDR